MADRTVYRSPLEGIAQRARWGKPDGVAGVSVVECRNAGFATLILRNDAEMALSRLVKEHFGLNLPTRPQCAAHEDLTFIGVGPGRWLVHSSERPRSGMERRLAPLQPHAAIVDQSHGLVLLRLSGARVRDALAKGVSIDLDRRVFKTGQAAATVVSHISVQLWQVNDQPEFAFAIPRGWALSFWDWLAASASEFGLEVLQSSDGEP